MPKVFADDGWRHGSASLCCRSGSDIFFHGAGSWSRSESSLLKKLDEELFNQIIFIPLHYEKYNYYKVQPNMIIPSIKYNLGIDITTIHLRQSQ